MKKRMANFEELKTLELMIKAKVTYLKIERRKKRREQVQEKQTQEKRAA
jgi:hypothetical protein